MKATYVISLPERAVRSLSALSGGFLREASELALPVKVRESTLYRATAGVGLRFLIERVGDVNDIYPQQDPVSRKFGRRYAVGSGIELVGIGTLLVSPVWVLAALADVTGASKTLFVQIGEALKAEGLLEPDMPMETMVQLLDGLERTSSHLAMTLNMPPLDVEGLRREWEQFKSNLTTLPASQLPDAADVERAWADLRAASQKMNRPVFSLSTALGASALQALPSSLWWLSQSVGVALRTTGMAVGGAFLTHYASALQELNRTGFVAYWSKHSRPYRVAAIKNFHPERKSWTERLFRAAP